MEVVNLVCRSRRPLEESESYVGEDTLYGSPSRKVLALHQAIVGRRATEREPVSFAVGALSRKGAATGYPSLEMKDMRRLQVRACGLVVVPVLIEPWDRERVSATVRRGRLICGLTQDRRRLEQRERQDT